MSYLCGLMGLRSPTIRCDGEGCTAQIVIEGMPPNWFLDNRPKRGWRLVRRERDNAPVYRRDYCPQHKNLARGGGTE
jgi:hypothetical protein